MKLTVTRPVEIEAVAISIKAPVRYGVEDIPADAPCRKGDLWHAIIEIDTGRILNWPAGSTLSMHMKVVDEGVYRLLDASAQVLAEREQDYVPSCIPGRYGDYIDFDIDANGIVKDWARYCTAERIAKSFFPREDS